MLNELIAEGHHGVVRAAEKFDHRKHASFSTYAEYWIKHHMRRVIDNHGGTIRIPCSALREIRGIKSLRFGSPGAADIHDSGVAEELGISEKRLRFLLLVSNTRYVSLEALENREGGELPNGCFTGHPDESPDGGLARRESIMILNRMFSELGETEQEVISMLFGLRSGKPESLEAISSKTGMSMYRTRKVRKQALDKLKALAGSHEDDLRALLR